VPKVLGSTGDGERAVRVGNGGRADQNLPRRLFHPARVSRNRASLTHDLYDTRLSPYFFHDGAARAGGSSLVVRHAARITGRRIPSFRAMPAYLVHRTRRTVHLANCDYLNNRFTIHTKIGRRGKGRLLADRNNYESVTARQPPKGTRCSVCLP
jgi:hypothetical protein